VKPGPHRSTTERPCPLDNGVAARENARMLPMQPELLGFAHHTGLRLAEVGFLLLLFAGVWIVAAQIPQLKLGSARTIVAGVALAIGGVLLIVATHWGHFGGG
jgi:hypothetical protein